MKTMNGLVTVLAVGLCAGGAFAENLDLQHVSYPKPPNNEDSVFDRRPESVTIDYRCALQAYERYNPSPYEPVIGSTSSTGPAVRIPDARPGSQDAYLLVVPQRLPLQTASQTGWVAESDRSPLPPGSPFSKWGNVWVTFFKADGTTQSQTYPDMPSGFKIDPQGGFIPPSCVTPNNDPVPPDTAFIGYFAYDAGPFRPSATEGILEPPTVKSVESKLRMLRAYVALCRSLAELPPNDSAILSMATETVNDARAVDSANGHAVAAFAQSIVMLASQEQRYESAYEQLVQARAAVDPANQVELSKGARASFQSIGNFLNAAALADAAQEVLTAANAEVLTRRDTAAKEQTAVAAAHRGATAPHVPGETGKVAIEENHREQQRDMAQPKTSDKERLAELERLTESDSAVQKVLVLKRFHRLPDHVVIVTVGGVECSRWFFGERYYDFDKVGELLGSGSV